MIPIPLQIWLFWSAVLLSTTTHAADWHVVTHTVSHHLTERANGKPWNEVNAGLGVRHQVQPNWSLAWLQGIQTTCEQLAEPWCAGTT